MGDVERLAEVLCPPHHRDGTAGMIDGQVTWGPRRPCALHTAEADNILRSDWLAAHDAEVAADARREALREAADAAVSDSDECVPWTHDHDRATVACWLHDRADREAASHTPEDGR